MSATVRAVHRLPPPCKGESVEDLVAGGEVDEQRGLKLSTRRDTRLFFRG